MKRVALFTIVFGAFIGLAAPVFADPVLGTWKTKPDDNGNFGHVVMAPCGAKLCGTLVKAFDGSGNSVASPNVGRQIVWDMSPAGAGKYSGGKVWAPDRDKTYNSRMAIKGAVLDVSGCVMGICRGSEWTRID